MKFIEKLNKKLLELDNKDALFLPTAYTAFVFILLSLFVHFGFILIVPLYAIFSFYMIYLHKNEIKRILNGR